MKKFFKIISILFVGLVVFSLSGCGTDANDVPATDSYTVEFIDYDGSILETISCTVGVECDILAQKPADPNYFDISVGSKYHKFTHWSVFDDELNDIDRDTTIEAIYNLENTLVDGEKITIALYAFFIICGILVALFLALREAKRIGLKEDDLIDGFLWIVPIAILGARLWYVAFEPGNFWYGGFFPSVLRTLGFTTGTLDFSSFGLAGLAIHGAFVTAIICAYFYTKKRKIDVFKVLDVVAVGFIVAQAFGRWGNFFNQEAHGGIIGGSANGVMSISLREQYEFLKYTLHLPDFIVNNMYITQGFHSYSVEQFTGFYHPTFLYESFINLIGFGVMLVLRRVKKVHFGELMSVYLVWYGALRIFIESLRTDPLLFDFLGITFKAAQVTSVIMILAGIGLSVLIRKTRKSKTYDTVPGYFGYVKSKTKKEVTEKE